MSSNKDGNAVGDFKWKWEMVLNYRNNLHLALLLLAAATSSFCELDS